jgi:hypothetical protein
MWLVQVYAVCLHSFPFHFVLFRCTAYTPLHYTPFRLPSFHHYHPPHSISNASIPQHKLKAFHHWHPVPSHKPTRRAAQSFQAKPTIVLLHATIAHAPTHPQTVLYALIFSGINCPKAILPLILKQNI